MLSEILAKLGVSHPDQLNAEEKKTYLAWQSILSSHEPNLDDVKKVLGIENERINAELRKYDNSERAMLYLQAYANLLKFISETLFASQKQREQLKRELAERFNL